MDKLQAQLLSIPARRVAANGKRRFWWAVGVTLVAIFGPITFLFILPLGIWPAAGSYAACLGLGVICWFVGLVRGTVSMPTLDDDDLEDETRKRAEKTLKVDVRTTTGATPLQMKAKCIFQGSHGYFLTCHCSLDRNICWAGIMKSSAQAPGQPTRQPLSPPPK